MQDFRNFAAWPMPNSPEQADLMIGTSDEVQKMHKDRKALITDLLSSLVIEATGPLMFHESSAPCRAGAVAQPRHHCPAVESAARLRPAVTAPRHTGQSGTKTKRGQMAPFFLISELHAGVVRPAAAFGRDPDDVLRRVLDVAGLAVHAVLRVDLQAVGVVVVLHELVHAGRAVAASGPAYLARLMLHRHRWRLSASGGPAGSLRGWCC